MQWIYDDGGREKSGYQGTARDCVTRSIAIATGLSYCDVYQKINELAQNERITKRRKKKSNARNGVHKDTSKKLLENLGWTWVSCMNIGSGCKVHLRENELPKGTLIVKVSKHMTVVKDGVIYDTHNPTRNGNRCVYGYFVKIS